MNPQGKLINGKVIGGIEWTKTVQPDGTEIRGRTSNPVRGCHHDCKWIMPDGTEAECYAKTTAEGIAQGAYPHGFEHHYWNPDELQSWVNAKTPMRIFWDSMSDLFGHWVPDWQIEMVLEAARKASWHTFQSLTKNAPRLLKFDLPANVWPGVSMPPDFMWGNRLEYRIQERMLHKMLQVLTALREKNPDLITWMSFEPLSWNVAPLVAEYPKALRWAVIGAASNGPKKYQPDPIHTQGLLDVLDAAGVDVFFKGNLIWKPWREDFPDQKL